MSATRYLAAVALGYALGRLTRRATPVIRPTDDRFDEESWFDEDDDADDDPRPVNLSHGYVPGLPFPG